MDYARIKELKYWRSRVLLFSYGFTRKERELAFAKYFKSGQEHGHCMKFTDGAWLVIVPRYRDQSLLRAVLCHEYHHALFQDWSDEYMSRSTEEYLADKLSADLGHKKPLLDILKYHIDRHDKKELDYIDIDLLRSRYEVLNEWRKCNESRNLKDEASQSDSRSKRLERAFGSASLSCEVKWISKSDCY